MLRKLFKYEFKSTSRWMLPVYAFVLLMGLLNMFFISGGNGNIIIIESTPTIGQTIARTLPAFFIAIYVFAIIAMALMTVFMAAYRFYTNLLSNQGYISLTLPVKTHEHIIAKLGTAVAWVIMSVLVGTLSLMIMLARTGAVGEFFREFPRLMSDMSTALGIRGGVFMAELIIYGLLTAISSIMLIYTALSVGQLSNNHKIGMSVLAYIGINFVVECIQMVLMFTFVHGILYLGNADAMSYMMSSIGWAMLGEVVLSAIYFFVTRYILTNRINLQ